MSRPLRDAIQASGLSSHALSLASGLDRRSIDRWLKGERDLRFESADALAAALGLRLGGTVKRKCEPKNPLPEPVVVPLTTTPERLE